MVKVICKFSSIFYLNQLILTNNIKLSRRPLAIKNVPRTCLLRYFLLMAIINKFIYASALNRKFRQIGRMDAVQYRKYPNC